MPRVAPGAFLFVRLGSGRHSVSGPQTRLNQTKHQLQADRPKLSYSQVHFPVIRPSDQAQISRNRPAAIAFDAKTGGSEFAACRAPGSTAKSGCAAFAALVPKAARKTALLTHPSGCIAVPPLRCSDRSGALANHVTFASICKPPTSAHAPPAVAAWLQPCTNAAKPSSRLDHSVRPSQRIRINGAAADTLARSGCATKTPDRANQSKEHSDSKARNCRPLRGLPLSFSSGSCNNRTIRGEVYGAYHRCRK